MPEYCAKIINEGDFDVDELLDEFEKKYEDISSKKTIYYSNHINSICFNIGAGKKANEKFDEITNEIFKKGNFKLGNVKIEKPKIQEFKTTKFWGNGELLKDPNEEKWNTLEHNGPFFPDLENEYNFMNSSLIYEGKKYPLNKKEEKAASFYAARIISEKGENITIFWTKDPVFNNNFWNDFKAYLREDYRKIMKDFSKIDWTNIVTRLEEEREFNNTEEKKEMRKIQKLNKDKKYKYGLLNGNREEITGYTVEPAAIYLGRGEQPKRGMIKKEVLPEDITINISKGVIINPPEGHKWGKIVNDKHGEWLASWKDEINGARKYMRFSRVGGVFAGRNEMYKFEMVRKLNTHIEEIRNKYMSHARSDDLVKKQLGTVLWLMDNHGVRIGNEKDSEEADTVGASTLRIENLTLQKNNTVHFKFLGKDSIQFDKKIENTPDDIFKNFTILMKGKNKNEQLFNKISSADINMYLKSFDKGFIGKYFRTRLASEIMFHALKKVEIPEGAKKIQVKTLFNVANTKVADVLNHVKTISKKAQQKVDLLKQELVDLENKKSHSAKENAKIEDLRTKILNGENTQAVALNTSLKNYIDPRIIVSWADKEDVDLKYIYSASLMTQFEWAIEMTEPGWDYENTPLRIESKLQPLDQNEIKEKRTPSQAAPRKRKNSSTSDISVSTKDSKDSKDSKYFKPSKESKEIKKKEQYFAPLKKTDKIVNVEDSVKIIDYDSNFIIVTGDTSKCQLDKIGGKPTSNLKDRLGKKIYGYQFVTYRRNDVFLHLLSKCENFNPSKGEIFDNKYYKDCNLLTSTCNQIKDNKISKENVFKNLESVDKEVWKALFPLLKNAYENKLFKSDKHKKVISIYFNFCNKYLNFE